MLYKSPYLRPKMNQCLIFTIQLYLRCPVKWWNQRQANKCDMKTPLLELINILLEKVFVLTVRKIYPVQILFCSMFVLCSKKLERNLRNLYWYRQVSLTFCLCAKSWSLWAFNENPDVSWTDRCIHTGCLFLLCLLRCLPKCSVTWL